MKIIKEHKGLLIFWIVILVLAILWCNYVEKDNDRMNAVKMQERS